jgi:ABC-2 type transport system ATP-binding protein
MIEVRNLVKHFGSIKAVDDISFSVKKGDILAFLGPNGAGKSTTMRMLTCFLPPTSGDAFIDSNSIVTASIAVRKVIGNVAENSPLYYDLSVVEFLKFVAKLRSIENSMEVINDVMAKCAVVEVKDQIIETLSKGYKKRVSMAAALLHDPKVLILDEPTDGLDPNQKFEVRTMIKNISQDKGVILSTHILEEMDELCNRAIIIAAGKILYDGTPDELRKKSPKGRVDDVFREITLGSKGGNI